MGLLKGTRKNYIIAIIKVNGVFLIDLSILLYQTRHKHADIKMTFKWRTEMEKEQLLGGI